MSAPRLIEKRLLWAAVLGFVVGTAILFLNFREGELGTSGSDIAMHAFLYLIVGSLSYSLLSLGNVGYCLFEQRGVHNDVVGFIGGFILAAGFGSFQSMVSLIFIGRGIFTGTAVASVVLTLAGLALVVKG